MKARSLAMLLVVSALSAFYVPSQADSSIFVYPPGKGTIAQYTLNSANGVSAPWAVATWP